MINFLIAALAVGLAHAPLPESDTLLVVGWNLENFFDFRPDGVSDSELEFSATGARRWSKRRFYRKCEGICKTLLWIGDREGRLPDIIAFEEVEGRFALRQLLSCTALRKLDYQIVHYDSPDPRGIDVALLFRESVFRLDASRPVRVGTMSDSTFRTRDILLAQLISCSGDSLAVMVNHHPSKYGGAQSEWRREAAVRALRELSDSLHAAGWRRQLALGDFNETHDNPLFGRLEPSLQLVPPPPESASIRFNGLWQLIDLAFASPMLLGQCHFEVCHVPFLTDRDATHGGEKPLRTYVGPRYTGGISDHRPIIVEIAGRR